MPGGGPGVYPLHAAAGAEYGEGYAGNAHRHAPDSWLTAVKYLVEELGADVNMRDDGGYTPLHHAAARGDNAVIEYLVSKGADVKAISRKGQTTADMANGPVSRISPYPDTIALLVKLGAINNNKCASCAPLP
jgi:ankyrin repeat protein